MIQTQAVVPAGAWCGDSADTVLLDFDHRHRRRLTLATELGQTVLLDLPQAVRLKDGDGLQLQDGRIIRVVAKPEPLLEIHANSPADLMRIAWHLGNRHLPTQLLGDRIRIRADHVIAEMVLGLSGHAKMVEAPFDPEGGAYAGGHHHHSDE